MHLELRFATNINTFSLSFSIWHFFSTTWPFRRPTRKVVTYMLPFEDTLNQPCGKTIHLVSEYPLVGQVLHQRHIVFISLASPTRYPSYQRRNDSLCEVSEYPRVRPSIFVRSAHISFIASKKSNQLNGETTSSARIHSTHRFGLTSSLGTPKFDLFSLLFFSPAHHLRTYDTIDTFACNVHYGSILKLRLFFFRFCSLALLFFGLCFCFTLRWGHQNGVSFEGRVRGFR